MARGLRAGVLPLIALCAGLLGVGFLEYRWASELARAEEERMRAAMEAASARFAGDLGRELGRLTLALRPPSRAEADDGPRYERAIEHWSMQAADPRLLRTVVLASEDAGAWRLRRLEGDAFVDAEWSADLEPVREIGRAHV